jgi:hypothetical protein
MMERLISWASAEDPGENSIPLTSVIRAEFLITPVLITHGQVIGIDLPRGIMH